ncbi:ribonuclease domain-containing protein [Amycolatopsis regifaucium]|uniref:Ribonuclease n=1 Tax=Amycolatopsis regifaucium TaxID=546365 RepID=A0A154MCJ2_9PSEU|nr:ribonuclease domain-containing protein [Amycolatopsis regifaucium]KZB81409.1 ribonuclease [Amycolatopsis regifaucium]OKA04674.1 ribonuclease [Amycolatopsis regifaucium]SFH32242.1 Guanyl-specific ribonuclease Sa [Amycolatopsis regifaucium]
MTNKRSRITATLLVLVVTFFGGIAVAQATTAETVISVQQNPCGDLTGFKHSALSSLPSEATTTYHLIKKGGPFPYPDKDGTVFSNRENILPKCASSYYHEYTVPTPGSPDRGARRIVTGSGGEFFYTGDHYATFSVIDVDGTPSPTCGDTSKLAKVGYSTLSSAAKSVVDSARGGAAGTVYENREGVLPSCAAGYYQLFPVGTSDRVISGKGGEIVYTPDRYTTFGLVNLAG